MRFSDILSRLFGSYITGICRNKIYLQCGSLNQCCELVNVGGDRGEGVNWFFGCKWIKPTYFLNKKYNKNMIGVRLSIQDSLIFFLPFSHFFSYQTSYFLSFFMFFLYQTTLIIYLYYHDFIFIHIIFFPFSFIVFSFLNQTKQ